MSDIQTLRSYLVELGFAVNNQQFNQFNAALELAGRKSKSIIGNISADLLKYQAAVLGLFTSVAASAVATVDKVAMADQQFRLFGERMFMNTERARSFKMAVDALGGDLGAIAFDPELHQRYNRLIQDQTKMSSGLGMDFETVMRQVRDVRFEFTRFTMEIKYFVMGAASELFKALGFGSGGLGEQLRRFNDYVIAHLPEWRDKFVKFILPILKDAWMIIKDVWQVLKDLAQFFTNLVGLLSMDPALMGAVSFDKFAKAVGKVAHWMAVLFHWLSKVTGLLVGSAGGAALGGAIGMMFGGPAGALAGAGIGAAAGGVAGGLFDLGRAAFYPTANVSLPGGGGTSSGIVGSSDLRNLAAQVGSQLGVDPSIIYAQWAHETGGFTNRGATSLHNLAGINVPGGGGQDYRSFASNADFANYYVGLIKRRYPGAMGAHSAAEFAAALKAGGYYGDSYKNYLGGMNRFMGAYSGGSTTNNIVINNPHGSPEQIAQAVTDKLNQKQARDNQRTYLQFNPAYGYGQ